MRRLGAIGTLVWDHIDNPFAAPPEPREQWGGAVYSFAALSAACPRGWRVDPIVKVGADVHIKMGDGDVLVLKKFAFNDLDASDFLL